MLENALKPSDNFRKTAVKSVWAIVLFIFTYIFLVAVSISLTIICGYLGIKLIGLYTSYITLVLGAGLIGFGFLVFFFLIKFMFKSNKTDRSHLVEITREEEPALFKMIDDIVNTVQTDFPKKVYLSGEVNAAVFYDSGFWSMFLPVRKNLQIGLGLINTTTAAELKAILAHEFGHFSQKSMKVGSYVYNVNRVIHNILYDNEGYDKVTRNIADSSSYFRIFVFGSEKLIGLMQQVLVGVYGILNASYSKLSHEMEFHADTVAAVTVGSTPLADSLLRMQLANQAMDAVLSYYELKIGAGVRTNNVFPLQLVAMNYLAKLNKLSYVDGFPQVDINYYNRFNKSKLTFSQVFSSHPETEERIARLKDLNVPVKDAQAGLAIDLLVSRHKFEAQLTDKMFASVNYSQQPSVQELAEFEIDFVSQYRQNNYPDIFNHYFDYRNPFTGYTATDFEQPVINVGQGIDQLFGEEQLSLIYELDAMESDWAAIDRIDSGLINTKTFNYDGQKYSLQDCRSMTEYLDQEIQKKKKQLEDLDIKIFEYFRYEAAEQNLSESYAEISLWYKQLADKFGAQQLVYADMVKSTAFMQTTTPFEIIKKKIEVVKNEEKKLKECIAAIQKDEDYSEMLTPEIQTRFNDYLSSQYKYFAANLYLDEQLNVLFAALGDFVHIIAEVHFKAKKKLLTFEAALVEPVLS